MSNDIYVWTGGAQGVISDAANWYDKTTHSAATAPPSSDTTLVFRPGTYSVTGDVNGGSGFSSGRLVLMPDAHVTLTSDVAGVFFFQNVTELAQASLTVSDAALWAASTVVRTGATLDATHAAIDAHALGIFATEFNSVTNTGGSVLYGDSAVGNVPPSGLNAGHPGPGFLQVGGFTPDETVVPGATTLRINLGTIAQGSTPAPLQIATDNPNGVAGYDALTISAAGHGFTTDLYPSIAAAMAAVQAPAVSGYVSIGTINLDTSTLGAHGELVSLKSAGVTTETLLITDRVV